MKNKRYELSINNVFAGNVFACGYEITKQNEYHGVVKGDLEFFGIVLYGSNGDEVYFLDGCYFIKVDEKDRIIFIDRD